MPRLSCFTAMGHLRMSSAPSYHQTWYEVLQKLWGSQLDFSQIGSYSEAKLYATARILAQVQGELEHAGNQANPAKAYEQIPILELDYGIAPPAKADYVARQRALVAAFAAPQGEIASNVVHMLRTILGSKFLAYVPNPARSPTVVPADPRSATTGQWVDIKRPAKYLKLVDAVTPLSGPSTQWVAYEAMDTSGVPNTSWSDNAAFSVGQTVLPTSPNAVGFYFTCSAPGTTGATEPTWPQAVGTTVVDGSVTWTCTATIAPSLVVGETVMVDAGNTSQHEQVYVIDTATVVGDTEGASSGNHLYFYATFNNAHDQGAPVTTGVYPYWWSTQRLAYIVLASAWASDPATQQSVVAIVTKIFRAVCQWAIVTPTSTTTTGGVVGPMVVGTPMGTMPIGAIDFVNSN
jgi:hypothetical protein